MKKASLPLLEISTLLVVLLGCVIAVVPGADNYFMHLLYGASGPDLDETIPRLAGVEPIDSEMHSFSTADGPERYASRTPLPMSGGINNFEREFLVDSAGSEDDQLPRVPMNNVDSEIVDGKQDPLAGIGVDSSDKLTVDELDIAAQQSVDLVGEPVEPMHSSDQLTVVENQELNGVVESEREKTQLAKQPAQSVENLAQAVENPDVGRDVSATASSGVKWTRNTTLSWQEYHSFAKDKKSTSKMDGRIQNRFWRSSREGSGGDWKMQALPAAPREINRKPIERQPMSAASMQDDNSFQTRQR